MGNRVGWEQEAAREGGAGRHQTKDWRGWESDSASFAGLSPFNSFIVITLKMPLYIQSEPNSSCLGGVGKERERMGGQAQGGGGRRETGKERESGQEEG